MTCFSLPDLDSNPMNVGMMKRPKPGVADEKRAESSHSRLAKLREEDAARQVRRRQAEMEVT